VAFFFFSPKVFSVLTGLAPSGQLAVFFSFCVGLILLFLSAVPVLFVLVSVSIAAIPMLLRGELFLDVFLRL